MDDSRLPTKDDSLLPTKDDSKSKEPKSHLSPRHNNSKPHHPSTTYASIHRNVFMEHPQNHPCQSGPAPDLASSRSTCECSEAPLEFPWFPWANGEQQFTGWGNQTIRFLAEGAANVVFRIVLPPDHADYAKFKGKLLRLRKDVEHSLPTEMAHDDFLRICHSRICTEHIVHQRLVSLPSDNRLIEQLNEALKWAETGIDPETERGRPSPFPPRHPKRKNTYLAKDDFGLLVTDMTAGKGETTVEFKPKWLAWSPSAPAEAIRCRSCARRAKRIVQEPPPEDKAFAANCCPFALLNDPATAARHIFDGQNFPSEFYANTINYPALSTYERVIREDIRFVLRQKEIKDVLAEIAKTQDECDPHGIANLHTFRRDFSHQPASVQDNFRLAMTFRDCTMFIRFPPGGLKNQGLKCTEIRVGDLDLKNSDKVDKWSADEGVLIDGGFYTGKERDIPLDLNVDQMARCALDCFKYQPYADFIEATRDERDRKSDEEYNASSEAKYRREFEKKQADAEKARGELEQKVAELNKKLQETIVEKEELQKQDSAAAEKLEEAKREIALLKQQLKDTDREESPDEANLPPVQTLPTRKSLARMNNQEAA